jgi:hypothetical protein
MKSWKIRSLLPLSLLAIALVGPQTTATSAPSIANKVLARQLDLELGKAQRHPYEQLLSSGRMYALLGATGQLQQRANAQSNAGNHQDKSPISSLNTQGCANTFTGGAVVNIRVNQDCSLRRQAEEVVLVNPTNPNNLVAGQNDSRIGFNHCGYDWSFDGGKTWGDQLPPFWQYVQLDGHTADACSDPTAAFDAQGNVYIGGIIFDLNSSANALIVMKSNAHLGGTFYHSPAQGSFQEYQNSPVGLVASDIDPNIAHDKELIAADSHPTSPKANNVYMTWTRFNAATGAGVGANSPIFFSQSTDGGATWSPGIEISGVSPACPAFSGETSAHACDQDQGSQPIVGPDGTVYVAFGNGNTPNLGENQHMIVSCPKTADCSKPASWTSPKKISDDFGKQPVGPDPVSGCPGGRQCLPPNGYRLDDFVEGSVSVDNNSNLYFAWADFRNGKANCNPIGSAATATPPCDNDVFYSVSTDRGLTWSPAVNVTPASRFGPSAQWQPWSAVSPDGKHLWIAYYDRHFGNCESTGCNDITLADVTSPAAAGSPRDSVNRPSSEDGSNIRYTRITTSSMPNLVPSNDPVQAGFLGDYMWVTVDPAGNPYIVWADTRGLRGTVEEDIYFATVKRSDRGN